MIESYGNYEWFLQNDLKEHAGKWLAIIDKKVVASGTDVSKLIQDVKKGYPNKKPLITKVQDKLSIL
ncbi:succinyl-CoA synthetase subunit alpha [Candidatus Woesearchaeota archaeon]|nr:succinyl-CoA synthetase subunit alpha [Candidatus Woesearchaeota archaeon]